MEFMHVQVRAERCLFERSACLSIRLLSVLVDLRMMNFGGKILHRSSTNMSHLVFFYPFGRTISLELFCFSSPLSTCLFQVPVPPNFPRVCGGGRLRSLSRHLPHGLPPFGHG